MLHRKRIVWTICVSVFLVILMSSTVKVSASTPTVGVKAGDWMRYGNMSFEWASNVPGQEEPPGIDMLWMGIDVVDVSDSNVTCKSDVIYENGTEEISIMMGNVATGEGNLSIGVIPSNLTAGDEIPANLTWYTEEPLKLFINGTVTRQCAGADREVNYVNITYPITYDNVTYGTWNISLYWDKTTGAICEEEVSYRMSYTQNMTQYYYNMSMSWRITATNMWPAVFTARDGYAFNVTMIGNSTISNFNFNETQKQISFNITCPTGKTGFCNVTIPQDLLKGPWTILVNTTDYTASCDITGNTTHTFIHIPHSCSTNKIVIKATWVVPEYPSTLIIPLLMITTLLTAILHRRQHSL